MESGGSVKDWEHLINLSSSTLHETKNLVGHVEQLLNEAKAQADHAKTMMWLAWATTFLAALALVASVVMPVLVR